MRKNVKNGIVLAVKIVISVGILALLFFKKILPKEEELQLVRDTLLDLHWPTVTLWLVGALVVKAAGMAFTVVRWRYLLAGQSMRIGWWHALGSFLIGRFIGSVSPGTSGLDGWRFYDVGRHAKNYVASGSVIVVEKIIGFFVLSVLLMATLPLGLAFFEHDPGAAASYKRYVTLFMLAAGVPLALCMAVLLRPGFIGTLASRVLSVTGRISPKWLGVDSRLGRLVSKVVASVITYEEHRGDLLKAVISGFPIHVATCSMYYFTAHALGVPVGYTEILFVAPIMIAATVVPVSIAGIGVREGVFVAFLGPVYGAGLVALFAFLGYLVGQSISLLGGPVWFARRADYDLFKQAQRREAERAARAESASEAEPGGEDDRPGGTRKRRAA
jgi:hypothetical protein